MSHCKRKGGLYKTKRCEGYVTYTMEETDFVKVKDIHYNKLKIVEYEDQSLVARGRDPSEWTKGFNRNHKKGRHE